MKKVFALLLSLILLCSMFPVALADEELPAARYEFVDTSYDGEYITGSVKHVEGTQESDQLFVRVTLFLENGSTSITVNYVDDDLTFMAGASGNIVHISMALTGTSRSVKPGNWVSMAAYEL